MILHDYISYDTLRIAWWLLLGVVLVGFALLDGFDLGTGIMLPFLGRDDMERRILINTVGPVWEGNQVWLVLAAGAFFAAWPQLYAVSFSGFYLAFFLVLFGLMLRPLAFKYHSERASKRWRTGWDWALFTGSLLPTLVFGIMMGNVIQGVPFRIEPDMHIFYEGSFFGLLNPYALLTGILAIAMFILQGMVWIAIKTENPLAARARRAGIISAIITILLYCIAGLLLTSFVHGYVITSEIVANSSSNPLAKTVETVTDGWFTNYHNHSILWLIPIIGIVGPLIAALLLYFKRPLVAILFSSLGIIGIISSMGVAMFPFIMPSTIDPVMSLTVWDSSSSHITLFIMLVITLIFIPIIFAYTTWIYKILWGKVREKDMKNEGETY